MPTDVECAEQSAYIRRFYGRKLAANSLNLAGLKSLADSAFAAATEVTVELDNGTPRPGHFPQVIVASMLEKMIKEQDVAAGSLLLINSAAQATGFGGRMLQLEVFCRHACSQETVAHLAAGGRRHHSHHRWHFFPARILQASRVVAAWILAGSDRFASL